MESRLVTEVSFLVLFFRYNTKDSIASWQRFVKTELEENKEILREFSNFVDDSPTRVVLFARKKTSRWLVIGFETRRILSAPTNFE